MAQTETLAQPQQAEQKSGNERLEKHRLRREVAKVAILAILIARLNARENDSLFIDQNGQQGTAETSKARSGEILTLLAIAFIASRGKKEKPAEETPAGDFDEIDPLMYDEGIDDLRKYREEIYAPEPQDFMPAPSHSEEPLGPELPLLDDKDQVYPQSREPSQTDVADANRANEMYQSALWKRGWRGGEATEEQRKAARRAMARTMHPDANPTPQDQAAFTAFSAMSARPVTPTQSGPEPSGDATSGAGGGEHAGGADASGEA
jgi:hypothetical protein